MRIIDKYPFLPMGLTVAAMGLSACAQLGIVRPDSAPAAPLGAATTAPPTSVLTSALPPPAAAKTQEALDTTTAAQRAEAAAPASSPAGTKSLGTTIASLGSPTEPGFWLKTPLVTAETAGRVTNTANGKSSAVTLIPLAGPATGGSQLSLPSMRLIEASLTDLTELEVTSGG